MTIRHIITRGFAIGIGLDLGSVRYIPTLGFGIDELSQQTTASHNKVIKDAVIPRRLKPYTPHDQHVTGTAFDEIR